MAYLTWKTPNGNIKMSLPTTELTGNLPAHTRTWFDSSAEINDYCKNTVGIDISKGTYMLNYPEFYINSAVVALANNYDTFDFDYDDTSWFTEPWECGDLRINWTISSSGFATGEFWSPVESIPSGADTFGFSLRPTSLVSEINMGFTLIYNPTEDEIYYLGPQSYANNFRIRSSTHNYGWYNRSVDLNSRLSQQITRLIKGNSSGGGGGFNPGEPIPVGGDDPYSPDAGGPGYSGSGGGPAPTGGTGTTGNGGLHDDTSDAIPTPSTPADVSISSGLFTAYNPSASQLASFAGALWNMQVSDINDVLRFLFGGDAFNAVIGLHLLPVTPSTGDSPNIKLGNWDTGVQAPKITSQYKQVSFGSVLLPEYWGNCIDYSPYTKIQLALPYIGIVDVDTDDVLGSTNTLTYNIDVLSGAICATLKCEKFNLNSVIYQWSGACAVSLPFSGASYNSVLGAIAGIAAAGMGFASMAAGPIGAALPAAALAAGGGAFGAGSAASIMGTMKGKVQKSGSFGANSGALGIMTPYFILTRPVQSVPETWQADKGYPANISAQLGNLTGYTEVSEINLECSGTEVEKNEIIDLLKKGVLF